MLTNCVSQALSREAEPGGKIVGGGTCEKHRSLQLINRKVAQLRQSRKNYLHSNNPISSEITMFMAKKF